MASGAAKTDLRLGPLSAVGEKTHPQVSPDLRAGIPQVASVPVIPVGTHRHPACECTHLSGGPRKRSSPLTEL